MRRPAVLVPFKAGKSKSRLSNVLDADGRRRFAESMLIDVLRAIRTAGLISRCFVVSSDPDALSIAAESGAAPLHEPSDRGVNSAVLWAMDEVEEEGEFMVLPADLPLLAARELRAAVSLGTHVDCVISPSKSFDGTNLLLFSRKTRPNLSYDSDSFWNHVRGAAKVGATLGVYCGKGVLFDVDSVEDLQGLARAQINTWSAKFATRAMRSWAS